MKRRFISLLMEVFCMLLLIGCGQDGAEDMNSPDMERTIFASKTLWDDCENLYEIPLDMLDGVAGAQVYRFGNDLLFTYEAYDANKNQNMYGLALVSLENGQLLYEQELEPLTYGVVQILDNQVAINDLGDGKSYLLNDKLELVDTYELQGGMFCLDKQGEKAYLFSYDKGIEAVDLAGGKRTAVFENGVNVYLCKAGGNEAGFIYTDKDTLLRSSGILDLNSGTIRTVESPYAFENLEASGDTWLGKVEGDVPFYVVSDEEAQGIFYGGINVSIGLNNASGHMMFYDVTPEEESIFLAYDNQGNLLSSCCLEGMTLYEKMDFAWYGEYNGYVFVLADEDNKSHLMFWDISGGFVNPSYQGKLLMALDARPMNLDDEINPILEGTMYHEFSHIIDKRLEFDAKYREEACYSESGWEELNPEGFEYNDSYYGTLAPQYADYFVDAYACTNSTEDRARIMECAMLGDKSVFEDKEGVRQKLAYYCEGIRDSFDTTSWPENLPWEEFVQGDD